jgi:asparagine synthase (glutamine-hydrolysing)
MCGIAGIISPNTQVDARLLSKMGTALTHRGPDDEGLWISPDRFVGLASRRLSIIDLSRAGHMPMSNEDGTVWVVFNGEIYNHVHLRSRLLSSGHRFRSNTDTEVLVHLYEERNADLLEEVQGMFAFALWDERRKRLFLARDRFGEKPLYMSEWGGMLRFASEMKAILADIEHPRHLDLESLSQYLTFGFVMPPKTLFSGIRKVAPGEMLTVDELGRVSSRFYASPLAEAPELQSIRSESAPMSVRKTRKLLEAAVASCMRADVPVGAFLSGGLDSSAIIAIMSRLTSRSVNALTVNYANDVNPEDAKYAKLVAKKVGADLAVLTFTEQQAYDAFPTCVYSLDEPIADPACINTYLASQEFRRQCIPVALVGEGADELFLGYPYYFRHSRLQKIWGLPKQLPKPARKVLGSAVEFLLNAFGYGVHRDLARRAFAGESLFLSSEPFYPDYDKASISGPQLSAEIKKRPASSFTDSIIASYKQELGTDLLAMMSLGEVRMRMAEKLLMRVDKLSMAHSIEVRAPFLDRSLAQYALSLRGDSRAPSGQPKGLLKAAVSDLLPAEILTRRKQGFSTPVSSWLRSSFGVLLESRLRSDLFRSDVLHREAVEALLAEHRDHRASNHTKLWNLLCLLEWYECFRITDIKGDVSHQAIPSC